MQIHGALQFEGVFGDLSDLAQFLAYVLGGIWRTDLAAAPVQEIIAVSAVESFGRVGGEARVATAGGTFDGLQPVQQPAVMRHHVLDVVNVFQAAFDLKGSHSGLQQGLKIFALVEVADREQVFVAEQSLAFSIHQRVEVAAGLGALSAVAAASADGVTQVALPAVADAQRAVDEGLQLQAGGGADLTDLLQAEFTSQDGALETHFFKEGHPLGGVVVHLGAGKQWDGRQVTFEQPGVLDDQGVRATLIDLLDQGQRVFDLIVAEQGVDHHVDFSPVAMRVADKLVNVGG